METMFKKTSCQHCAQHIEFDAANADANLLVECPACHNHTRLICEKPSTWRQTARRIALALIILAGVVFAVGQTKYYRLPSPLNEQYASLQSFWESSNKHWDILCRQLELAENIIEMYRRNSTPRDALYYQQIAIVKDSSRRDAIYSDLNLVKVKQNIILQHCQSAKHLYWKAAIAILILAAIVYLASRIKIPARIELKITHKV